jgi:hypothetical protein
VQCSNGTAGQYEAGAANPKMTMQLRAAGFRHYFNDINPKHGQKSSRQIKLEPLKGKA